MKTKSHSEKSLARAYFENRSAMKANRERFKARMHEINTWSNGTFSFRDALDAWYKDCWDEEHSILPGEWNEIIDNFYPDGPDWLMEWAEEIGRLFKERKRLNIECGHIKRSLFRIGKRDTL